MAFLNIISTALILLTYRTCNMIGALQFDEQSVGMCKICSCSSTGREVDCSNRGLTTIPQDYNSFQVYTLNSSNNQILVMPSLNAFTNLINLDLSNNKIRYLPFDSFQNMKKLEEINLSNNSFQTFENLNNAFRPVVNLKVLDLSNNKIDYFHVPKRDIIASISLRILKLNSCNLTYMSGTSLFEMFPSIEELQLNNNPLLYIHKLSSQRLKILQANFCQLSSLSNLNIQENSIQYLDISYCSINILNMKNLSNLITAKFNNNFITKVNDYTFHQNRKLKCLDLSYNLINFINEKSFHGLDMLEELDLSGNKLVHLPDRSLLLLSSLKTINLTRNYLNNLGNIESTSLISIDISSCEINKINKNSIKLLTSLVFLNLSNNYISDIPSNISSNTLKYLNLNYNKLTSINSQTFYKLTRLTYLELVGNRFTTPWSKSYFKSNIYLRTLHMTDNLWHCDCSDEMLYFYEFLTPNAHELEKPYNLLCNTPLKRLGHTWLEACYFTWHPNEKTLKNPDNIILFLVIMIIGLGSCLIIVNGIKTSMNRRLAAIQVERERQIEEARERTMQIRTQAEQQALCNAPDPRDLISPPSYTEAISMPKLNVSCSSLCDMSREKSRKRRARRKVKSSGDIFEETQIEVNTLDDSQSLGTVNKKHKHKNLSLKSENSNDVREQCDPPTITQRRPISEYDTDVEQSITLEVQAEVEELNNRINIPLDNARESSF